MQNNNTAKRELLHSPRRVQTAEGSTSSSSPSRTYARVPGNGSTYPAFRSHPPPLDYSDRTKPFFTHTVPTRVIAKHPPAKSSSTELLKGPIPFNVCGCDEEETYIAPDFVHLPPLRGCHACHPAEEKDKDGQGLATPRERGVASTSKASASLPRTEERLPPLTHALHIVGQDTVAFRTAVVNQGPPFPFTQKMSDETKAEVREYLRMCKAAHLFNYLSRDILRDKPGQPIEYITAWLKSRRALYSSS